MRVGWLIDWLIYKTYEMLLKCDKLILTYEMLLKCDTLIKLINSNKILKVKWNNI